MKKLLIILSAFALMLTSCGNTTRKTEENYLPKVYMTSDISADGLVKVYEALGVKPEGEVAVKIAQVNRVVITFCSQPSSRILFRK